MSARMLIRGSRTVEPRVPYLPPDRPDFFTDRTRRCSPAHDDWEMWTSDDKKELGEAARLCRSHCPFLQECRTWATENNERWGAWGGLVFSKQADRDRARAARIEQVAV
jgi:hypothetical protein